MRGARAQIVSGSRDKTIKLWNTLGECKYTIGEPDGHTEWVSCVRFSPVVNNPLIVSAGWDRQVKVRALTLHADDKAGAKGARAVLRRALAPLLAPSRTAPGRRAGAPVARRQAGVARVCVGSGKHV